MSRWWPVFEPWPRNQQVRRAITVSLVAIAIVVIALQIIGPGLTWLTIVIAVCLWVLLVVGLVIEHPKRRRAEENDKPHSAPEETK